MESMGWMRRVRPTTWHGYFTRLFEADCVDKPGGIATRPATIRFASSRNPPTSRPRTFIVPGVARYHSLTQANVPGTPSACKTQPERLPGVRPPGAQRHSGICFISSACAVGEYGKLVRASRKRQVRFLKLVFFVLCWPHYGHTIGVRNSKVKRVAACGQFSKLIVRKHVQV